MLLYENVNETFVPFLGVLSRNKNTVSCVLFQSNTSLNERVGIIQTLKNNASPT